MTVFADHLHCPTGFEFYNGGVYRRQAPGPAVSQGHQRRRPGRLQRARARRPRLRRHAPHGQQLRARSGRRALLPGRHLPSTRRSRRRRAARALRQRAASFALSRRRTSSKPTSAIGFRQSARARVRPLGQRHRHRRHRRRALLRRRASRGKSISRRSTHGIADGLQAAHAALPRHRDSLQPALPRRICRAICWSANVIGFQGILNYKLNEKGSGLRRHRSRADRAVERSEFPPGPRSRSAPTARSTSSTGKTRSSATCSTTSRDPNRDHTHGRIYRITYESRPLLSRRRSPAQPIEQLLDLLKSPENRVRYQRKIELSSAIQPRK